MNADLKKIAARTEQMVRKPVGQVFTAFIEPHWLVQFWLDSASAPLALGRKVRWDFRVKGAVDELEVLALEPDRLIRVRGSDGSVTEWHFTPRGAGETIVRIEQRGFTGMPEEIVAAALEATQGYTIVLCALKVLLEDACTVQLVDDKAELIERARTAAGQPG